MSRHSRRRFLSSSAAAAGALALGAYANPAAAQESKSPNERLRIAGVGTTNRAGADLNELSSQEIVALADVDDDLERPARHRRSVGRPPGWVRPGPRLRRRACRRRRHVPLSTLRLAGVDVGEGPWALASER